MHNVSLPLKRFKIYIHFLVHASKQNNDIDYINKSILHNLVVNEGLKVYRTIYVDEENQQDLYRGYKQLVTMLADIILEINSDFKYPRAMATNFFEMVNNHIYFSEHLPQLTDIKKTNDRHQAIENLLIYYSEKLLGIDLQSV